MDVCRETRIENSRKHTLFNSLEVLIGGNDCRQVLVVTVIEDLVQLLPRPGRGIFSSQIVEDEQLRVSHCCKAVVISHAVCGVERCSEVIEQIGYDGEEHAHLLPFHRVERNSNREMSLPRPAIAMKKEPAVRIPGVFHRGVVRVLTAINARIKGIKGPVGE